MTDLLIEVFPEGPVPASVVVAGHPAASGATVRPYPVAAAVTAAPIVTVTAVAFTPSGIAATASGAQGVELIVHPHP